MHKEWYVDVVREGWVDVVRDGKVEAVWWLLDGWYYVIINIVNTMNSKSPRKDSNLMRGNQNDMYTTSYKGIYLVTTRSTWPNSTPHPIDPPKDQTNIKSIPSLLPSLNITANIKTILSTKNKKPFNTHPNLLNLDIKKENQWISKPKDFLSSISSKTKSKQKLNKK